MALEHWEEFREAGHRDGKKTCAACKDHEVKPELCNECGKGLIHGISHWWFSEGRDIEKVCDHCYYYDYE